MLPSPPSDFRGNSSAVAALSPPEKRSVEPIGLAFAAHARRVVHGRTWTEHELLESKRNVKSAESVDSESDEEPESASMLRHDPKDWKSLDQYAVLGLSKYRWRATDEQIKNAYRRKVMKHHPDKKAAGGAGHEDGFFKCIQKAYETLCDPAKRRQWDSVDKKANVAKPKKSATGDFFELWRPVFESEGRFSKLQPVPPLGEMDTPQEEVEEFYTFWYNFDSWRSFEWLDQEVPDDSASRDHRRFVEKKNKAARTKLKTEDNARLNKLVDTAMARDPRIKLFKEQEKQKRAEKKAARLASQKKR